MKTRLCSLFLFAICAAASRLEASPIAEADAYDCLVQVGSATDAQFAGSVVVGQTFVGSPAVNLACYVVPFRLPYLAAGQKITGATVTFHFAGTTGSVNFNADLYGLARHSATPEPVKTDYFSGPDDLANTKFARLASPSSTPGALANSDASLAAFVQRQYAASNAEGTSSLAERFIFFRLNADTADVKSIYTTGYIFSTGDNADRALIPTLTLTISGTPVATPGRLEGSFQLDADAVTSAGIYSGGVLRRTLWSNKPFTAGTNYFAWDGADDFGRPLGEAPVQVRVVSNKMAYVWEGVIGNTSASQTGGNVFRSFTPINCMDISGTTACYATGYNEQQPQCFTFSTTAPQVCHPLPSTVSIYSAVDLVAYGGRLSYWAKTGKGQASTVAPDYIFALNADGKPVTFPSGDKLPEGEGERRSGFDLDRSTAPTHEATGLAVQKNGAFIFVAHANGNAIHVFDKSTGASVTTIPAPSPGLLATDAAGNLWVISGRSILGYTIDPRSGAGTLTKTINGLTDPVGIGASGNVVVVADGGASQRLKAFSIDSGAPAWSYGVAGGQPGRGPAVTNDCFWFGKQTYVAFVPDGSSFWVGDQQNFRNLHFALGASGPAYLEQISYVPVSYLSSVDLTDPTRVFSGMLEYKINYALPPGGTNGSWTLVRNWRAKLPSSPYVRITDGFENNVVTLKNGRTYAVVASELPGQHPTSPVVELPADCPLRLTSTLLDWHPARIMRDGTLRSHAGSSNGVNAFLSWPLSGFDPYGNPLWGRPTTLAAFRHEKGEPFFDEQGWSVHYDTTDDGHLYVYDTSKNEGFHLGGLLTRGTSFVWQALASTAGEAFRGPLPTHGHYDVGNNVNYAGDIAEAVGPVIIAGYHGEGWKQSQASTFYVYNEDGLMLGSFGTPGNQAPVGQAVAGFAGNDFSWTVTRNAANGNVYLYTNDESNHAGMPRWRIDGLSTIKEASGAARMGTVLNLPPPSPVGR